MNQDGVIELSDDPQNDPQNDPQEKPEEINKYLEEAKKLLQFLKNEHLLGDDGIQGNNSFLPTRYFKCVYNGEAFGRFSGAKPKQAANKALTYLMKLGHESPITFSIVECSRGSKHKEYKYKGERIELDKPMEVNIGGHIITYRFNNRIMKVNN